MDHSFLDKYSHQNSFLQNLDPRVKLLTALFSIIIIVATPAYGYNGYVLFLGLILFLAVVSSIPIFFLLKKSLYFLPFTVTLLFFSLIRSASADKWIFAVSVFAKSCLAFLVTVLLISTTRFEELLKGMEKLKIPKLVIVLFSFMYRYFFVLIDELMRMFRAAKSRSPKKFKPIRFFGNIIGVLFVRTYDRAERIYQAMISRGFDGEIHTLNELSLRDSDKGFLLVSAGVLIIIVLLTF